MREQNLDQEEVLIRKSPQKRIIIGEIWEVDGRTFKVIKVTPKKVLLRRLPNGEK